MFVLDQVFEKPAKPVTEAMRIATVLSTMWRRKVLAFGTLLAVLDLVLIALFAVTPKFEATTLLSIGQNSLDGSPEVSRSTFDTTIASMVRIVESEDVVRQAVEKVGLATLVGSLANPIDGASRPTPVIENMLTIFPRRSKREITALDRAVPGVISALEVKREPNSNIIRISFRHEDAAIAVQFADAVAQSFVDRQLILFSRPGAADFYQHQKTKFDDEIKRASDELQEFVTANKIYSISDERQLLLKRASDSSGALAMTRGAIVDKKGEKETLTAQLRLLKPVTQSPFVSSLVDTLGHDDQKGSVAASRTAPQPDERRLAEAPPLLMVRVYQDTMVALFKVNGELAGLENLQQEQTEELQRINVALNELSSNEAEFSRLKRVLTEASINAEIYARKMVEEQISAESSAAKFSTVKVVQEARVSLKPISPHYFIIAGLGLAAALIAAVAVALGADALARPEPAANATLGSSSPSTDNLVSSLKRPRRSKKSTSAKAASDGIQESGSDLADIA